MESDTLAPVRDETFTALKICTFVVAQLSIFHPPQNPTPASIWESTSMCGGLSHLWAAGRHNGFQRCVP
jgi:hypothetical protein